jgi:hypothetical protein
MSRLVKFLALGAAAVLAVSCGRSAKIDAVVSGLPSSDVVVKLLNVNKFEVLDTVATDAAGKLSYKVAVEKGQPEFVYLFHNDVKIASMILQCGDKVSVEADTLGNFTVKGSEESLKLAQVEKNYAEALMNLTNLSDYAMTAQGADLEAARKKIGQEYVNYYRNSVKYVMENSKSLTVVPVFFQNFGSDLPVFSQSTDALHFAAQCSVASASIYLLPLYELITLYTCTKRLVREKVVVYAILLLTAWKTRCGRD